LPSPGLLHIFKSPLIGGVHLLQTHSRYRPAGMGLNVSQGFLTVKQFEFWMCELPTQHSFPVGRDPGVIGRGDRGPHLRLADCPAK
jgi:hypothetical protein